MAINTVALHAEMVALLGIASLQRTNLCIRAMYGADDLFDPQHKRFIGGEQ
jgi:hypothetical protein